ncbi:N-glycosylase/DNA lyase [Candidatus Woesearchaeota archaeon]|nr:N-glycosylase/DNA lyase [Candidatus Woesearchaeota archaeon]
MKELSDKIDNLKANGVKAQVETRLEEFEALGKKPSQELFKEMCFCILTANSSAKKCMEIQQSIDNGFLGLPKEKLAAKLKELGYRFPNKRAEYISEARKHKDSLRKVIEAANDEADLRQWLVKNVKGLGYKEASHFLRNIGFKGSAILDFHIIDILDEHKLIQRPKSLTPKKYLEIENELKKIGQKLNLNMAELDLYLWCAETGTVLK